MIHSDALSRRTFLALSAAASAVPALAKKKVPIGLELYSVRDQMDKDVLGTVRAVGKMGYDGVEFYGPYFAWTSDYAKQVRKVLDESKMKCYSTHNGSESFDPKNYDKAVELNTILGSKFIVMASAGKVEGLEGWKRVAEKLNAGAEKFKSAGIRAGYHNHQTEFKPIDGTRPIEVIAKNTGKDVMLQFDIGTCLEAGSDPVAWIEQNPGRINSLHCKDWSPDPGKGYEVLFGEGVAKWQQIITTAEKKGGLEYLLIEQEGGAGPSLEAVEKCLASIRKLKV